MHNDLLIALTLVIGLGVGAQLIAWRTGLPSILLLLMAGLIAGPLTGILDINRLLGDLLFPIVSLSVAIILFEGGLSLRLSEIREDVAVVYRLIIIGTLVTWLVTALAARVFLGLHIRLSLLLGAVLVVTGPTVIIPLLQQIRPRVRLSHILRWEGIIIDPVGALLALLVFEGVLLSTTESRVAVVVSTTLRTVVIGVAGGWVFARIMTELYSRTIVPVNLQNAATIMFIIISFTISNVIQPESGLATVTAMGFFMANQNRTDTRHIIEFKENLQILLIAILFVLLSARLELASLMVFRWGAIWFLIAIIVIRPVVTFIATIGSGLTWRDKVFLGWMAPRGIVAASVASLFAVELAEEGFAYDDPDLLVSYTFEIIITTVVLYGLTAGLVARWLNVTERYPQGVLLLGAQEWARRIGIELSELGFRVIMADSNPGNILASQRDNLETYQGNILAESVIDDIDLGGVGRLLAMTPNSEVNSLASVRFSGVFNRSEVYQLASRQDENDISQELSGRQLFGDDVTYDYINQLIANGAQIETLAVDDVPVAEAQLRNGMLPLFSVTQDQELNVWTNAEPPPLNPGDRVIALAKPDDASKA